MKLKFAPLAAFILLAVFFTSCSDKSNIPVPADAAVVFHLNGKSLNEKLTWDEVKQSEWYKMAYEEVKDELAKKILDNPENSGIDVKSDAYFFIRSGGGGTYAAFTCTIKNEKAFAEFMAKATEGATPKKDGDISMITSPASVLSWSNSRFVAVMNTPDANPAAGAFGGRSQKEYDQDSLVVFAKDIYTIKGKKSLGSNSRFSSLMKENGDAHIWVNAGGLYGRSMPAMLAITKVSLLFEGNVSAATINFENGKIVLDAKSYYNKELAALYKKYSMKDIDPAIFKKIPVGDVAAVMAMNYPPEGLKEFVRLLGVDGLLNMVLAQENFNIDDFIKANKGDILVAVSDFKVQKQPVMMDGDSFESGYTTEKPEAKILFGASIGDKASFDKMLNLLSKKIAEEGGPAAGEMAKKIPYAIKEDWFLAGSDSAYLNSFGTSSTDHSFISKISGHPLAGYIDIQKFINGSRPVMDSAGTKIADEALKVWENIIFYGGEYKDDATLSHAEINFVDKNTNSLKQLNNFISFMVMQEREKMKRFNNDILVDDSVMVVPAPAPGK